MSAKPWACISLMSAPAANAFSRSGQHQAALAGVGIIGGEGVDQLLEHGRIERVERLRAVQGDQRHRALLFDQDGFVAHRSLLKNRTAATAPRPAAARRKLRPRHRRSRPGLVGCQLGSLSLSISRARTPSLKSGWWIRRTMIAIFHPHLVDEVELVGAFLQQLQADLAGHRRFLADGRRLGRRPFVTLVAPASSASRISSSRSEAK